MPILKLEIKPEMLLFINDFALERSGYPRHPVEARKEKKITDIRHNYIVYQSIMHYIKVIINILCSIIIP